MPKLLNPKREALAQGMAEGKSNTQAYIDAGFSPKSASSAVTTLLKLDTSILKRRDEIIDAFKQKEAEALKCASLKLAINKEWVLAELVGNVKMAKAAQPVVDHEGNETGEYQTNLAAANKALELIGKEFGMFIDRKEIRTGPLTSLTDEQIDSLIASIDSGLTAKALKTFGRAGTGATDQGESAQVLLSLH